MDNVYRENWMIRKFKCAFNSVVNVSYSFVFCETENQDYMVAMNIDQTCESCDARTDNMARQSPAQVLSTDWNSRKFIYDAKDYINSYPDKDKCDWNDPWWNKTVTDAYIGQVDAGVTWQLALKTSQSASDEYVFIYNIQIECIDAPTSTPTIDPTTTDPTVAPSMAPSVSPTEAPSIAFGNPTPAPITSP
eukprot:413841_1